MEDNGIRYAYLLMGGHIMADMAQGALSCVAAFLVLHDGFSYAQATALVFFANMATAVVQPLFGWIGDRYAKPWIMALGVFFACGGVALIGVTQSYPVIVAAAMLSGLGVDMFHPEGGRLAHLVAGGQKSRGMSIFSVGGNIGFALGPVAMTAAIGVWGMRGTVAFAVPAVVYALVLLAFCPVFARYGGTGAAAAGDSIGGLAGTRRDCPGRFAVVILALSLRSVISYGVSSFVALYMVQTVGSSEWLGSMVLAATAVVSAAGTVAAGFIGDRIPPLPLSLVCYAVMAAASLALAPGLPLAAALVCLAVLSFSLTAFNPSLITYSQDLMPNRLGLASGMSLGVAVCAGGAGTPLMGMVADVFGVGSVFSVMAGAAVAGAAIVAVLAVTARRGARGQA